MSHLDPLRILHRVEGRQFPWENELTCLGPFHRELKGLQSQVAHLRAPDLEGKELGSHPDCLGSRPSLILPVGGLCNSPEPRFPHLWNGDGNSAGRKLETPLKHDQTPVPPEPALESVWLGFMAGWSPPLAQSQALTHVFALVYQVETQLRAGARPGPHP